MATSTSAMATMGHLALNVVQRWRGAGWGSSGVVTEFRHEGLKALSSIGSGNDAVRHGIWPCDTTTSPGPVSVSFCSWQRVAVTVQFSHRDWGA